MANTNWALVIGIPLIAVLILVFLGSASKNLSGFSSITDFALADDYVCTVSLKNPLFKATEITSATCQNVGSCPKTPSTLFVGAILPLLFQADLIAGISSDDIILEARNSDVQDRYGATINEGQLVTKEIKVCTRDSSLSLVLKDQESQSVIGGSTITLK